MGTFCDIRSWRLARVGGSMKESSAIGLAEGAAALKRKRRLPASIDEAQCIGARSIETERIS
jgi:hypothetical protein